MADNKKDISAAQWTALATIVGAMIVLCGTLAGLALNCNKDTGNILCYPTKMPPVNSPQVSGQPSEPTITTQPADTAPSPSSPTENSNPFISSKVRLENIPFREIDPGSNNYPPYEINTTIPRLTGIDVWQVQSFNQFLSSYVTGEVDNFRQEFKGAQSSIGGTSTLDLTYVLVAQVGDVWSFRFDFSFYYSGAAHPSEKSIVLNYDLNQGRKLALSDLFVPDSNYLQLISDYCINQLTNKFGTDGFFPDGAKPTLDNYTKWNIRSDGILITFDVYQVAAGAAGPQEVLMPYSELKPIIKSEGPLLFLYR